MKRLGEMTLEQLWQLFPIELRPYQRIWKDWAKEEIGLLLKILDGINPVISHIGSTAIEGIMAKPIIDLLVELPEGTDLTDIRTRMEANGYICMAAERDRLHFNKGYTPTGYAARVFHIHFHPQGERDEIIFRDYLRSHPEAAREYEALKLSLLPEYRNNRDGYTQAKSEFIRNILSIAKRKSQVRNRT